MAFRSHRPRAADENGFTLVELLVVMVVIGILAAIAIPSFLAQRDKGYQATEKSDLQNVALAERAYTTDYGVYVSDVVSYTSTTGPLSVQGARASNGDVVTATPYQSTNGTAADSYCLYAAYASKTSTFYWLTSDSDTPVKTKPAACP